MKYFKVYIELIKQSFIKAMAYKTNFIIVFLSNLVFFSIQLIFIKVIYTQLDLVCGWTKYEMFLYIGTYNIIDSLWVFGPFFNLMNLPSMIRDGSLDGYLLKPINCQFLVSLKNVDIGSIISILTGICMVFYAFFMGKFSMTYSMVLLYCVGIVHSLLVLYSIYFIMICLSFWLIKTDFANIINGIICYFATKPIDVYRGIIRKIMTFIVPYGLLITISSKTIINKINLTQFMLGIALSWGFFLLSIVFWRFSLKKYSSASS